MQEGKICDSEYIFMKTSVLVFGWDTIMRIWHDLLFATQIPIMVS